MEKYHTHLWDTKEAVLRRQTVMSAYIIIISRYQTDNLMTPKSLEEEEHLPGKCWQVQAISGIKSII